MKQYTENQYDDDLTVGTDGYEDSYYTDEVDLFEFSTDNEAPISKLKNLILSIDWEITDDILRQFNEELVDLKDIWAGEKINLVYIQALEKISKYIYQFKADSHPNSIKLLLTLYYNLEKIVSSDELTEEDKKKLLMDDVKKFEQLKQHISKQDEKPRVTALAEQQENSQKGSVNHDDLRNLKAIVLGIDWEITDQDLNDLRKEVISLEEKFSGSRPKLIFLQGIGTLGAYIKLKKSNAHADAFKVLHLFFENLEKIVETPMSLEEEKAVLFPAVEKFNAFKAVLGSTISPESINQKEAEEEAEEIPVSSDPIVPAFADISEEQTRGFQADQEAQALGIDDVENVSSHINNFFSDSTDLMQDAKPEYSEIDDEVVDDSNFVAKLEESFVDHVDDTFTVDKETALQGVDVETDDDIEEDLAEKEALATGVASKADDLPIPEQVIALEDDVEETDDVEMPPVLSDVDRQTALQGVDVESEADNDSNEKALPTEEGQLAPALPDNDEESIFSADELENIDLDPTVEDEIFGKLDGFFGEKESVPKPSGFDAEDEIGIDPEESVSSAPVDLFSDGDDIFEPGELPAVEDSELQGDTEEEITPADEIEPALVDVDYEGEDLADDDFELEESLSAFLDDAGGEKGAEDSSDVEALFGSFEEELPEEKNKPEDGAEVDVGVDDFWSLEEGIEELEEDALLFSLPVEEMSSDSLDPALEIADESVDAVDDSESKVSDVEKVSGIGPVSHSPKIKLAVGSFVAHKVKRGVPVVVDEEVVFELVDEVEPVADSGTEGVLTELADMDKALSDSSGREEQLFEDNIESDTQGDIFFEDDRDVVEGKETDVLQDCIYALELELDDKIISGLLQEINRLRQKWTSFPQKKLFLQLLSIVAQHIDQYRYESSAEAYGLLLSISEALFTLNEDDSRQNDDSVATQTLKVLQWQQGMLARQAVRQGGYLSFADPVRTEGSVAGQDVEVLQSFDEQLQSYERQQNSESDVEENEMEPASFLEAGSERDFTEGLRSEISNLRQTLQKEIAELRREIRDDSSQ